MDFRAYASYAALFCVFEENSNQAAADSLASPLRSDEERDNIHCFPAEFRTPFVRSVSVAAKHTLRIFGNNDKPAVGSGHNVLKHAAGIFNGSLCTNVHQKLTSE